LHKNYNCFILYDKECLGMEANDELMTIFHEIAGAGETVTLLNTYRGFPINYPAYVIAVDRGMVGLNVHPHQAVCMALEGKTHLQSPRLLQIYRQCGGRGWPKQRGTDGVYDQRQPGRAALTIRPPKRTDRGRDLRWPAAHRR
jgi:hypothetical protein